MERKNFTYSLIWQHFFSPMTSQMDLVHCKHQKTFLTLCLCVFYNRLKEWSIVLLYSAQIEDIHCICFVRRYHFQYLTLVSLMSFALVTNRF